MRKQPLKLALTAVLMLALTFTSCFDNDDDDEPSGGAPALVSSIITTSMAFGGVPL